jgi:hypothetical protein
LKLGDGYYPTMFHFSRRAAIPADVNSITLSVTGTGSKPHPPSGLHFKSRFKAIHPPWAMP